MQWKCIIYKIPFTEIQLGFAQGQFSKMCLLEGLLEVF